MKTFTDNGDPPKSWDITISVGTIKRVRGLLDVDLGQPQAGDPPIITRLDLDVELFCDVLFAIVKPQADERGITDEQFGGRLLGTAIKDAREAFWAEWLDFFQKLGRPDQAAMISKQVQMVAAALAEATLKVEAIDVADKVSTAFASVTSSPESSE